MIEIIVYTVSAIIALIAIYGITLLVFQLMAVKKLEEYFMPDLAKGIKSTYWHGVGNVVIDTSLSHEPIVVDMVYYTKYQRHGMDKHQFMTGAYNTKEGRGQRVLTLSHQANVIVRREFNVIRLVEIIWLHRNFTSKC